MIGYFLAFVASESGCSYGYDLLDPREALGGSTSSGNSSGDGDAGEAGTADGGRGGTDETGGMGGDEGSGGAQTNSGGRAGEDAAGGSASGESLPLFVSTAVDEEDVGATRDDPMGTGLSLREAILIANAEPGHQAISFESDYSVVLDSQGLPTITESLDLVGVATIDGRNLPASVVCLETTGSDILISSFSFENCPTEPIIVQGGSRVEISDCTVVDAGNSIAVTGDDHRVLRNEILRSPGAGIWCDASSTLIEGNRIVDTGVGISFTDAGSASRAIGNVIIRNHIGIGLFAPAGVIVVHNTVHDSDFGVTINGATDVDVQNNVIVGSLESGVDLTAGGFLAFDANLFWANAVDCTNCTPGAASVFADPNFEDPDNDDLNLAPLSPAIDQAIDLGYDRNSTAPGLFNGAAPDMGALESQ